MNDIVNLEGTSLAEQKEYNNKLFRLFDNMVNPLSGLEHLYMVRRNIMSEMTKLEQSNIRGKVLAVSMVGGLIVYYFLGDFIYDIPLIGSLLHTDFGMWVFLFLCVIGTVYAIYTIDKKNREKKIALKHADMDNVDAQIQQAINQMHDRLQFIPPSYCHSDAMRYFARAYIDGKVENVKEAMISYDEYVHRQNMENGQYAMIQQQGQILANQVALQQQLSYDTAMIILSNFAFR